MGLFIQPAMSQISTNADLAYAFGASPDTLQLDLLTSEEMESIKGVGIRDRIYNAAKHVWDNTQIDGYNGTRIIQVRWKNRPIMRIDNKDNPSPTKVHIHFGKNMNDHRPWNAPWRKY